MDEKRGNFPFYNWVPRPVGILILLTTFIPPTFSGGAYLSNLGEMSGGLALWTEDIQLASFFTSIGMCLFVPFMLRFLQTRRVKHTYIWCFSLLVPLNYICAVTDSIPVLLTACLLIGFVRIIVMLNCTFTIAPYLTGANTLSMFTMKETPTPEVQYKMERMRTFLMPVLYSFILAIAQASNVVTAWFAYEYHWQDAYYAVIGMLLVAILLVVVTMPDEENRHAYRIEWRKVPELLLMTVFLCCMAYVLVFGKTLDWFDSQNICLATASMLISAGFFLLFSLHNGEDSYLPLKVFSYRNIWMSILLFMLIMIFNSANTFVSSFAKLSTSINNLRSASLSGWAIVGCLLGLVLSVLLIIRKVHFRTVFIFALLLMAGANCFMYFQYQTSGLFSNMFFPTVLHFSGLLILYSLIAAFGMKSLPSRYLATFVFLMIWMRNAIAPVVGTSIFSNLLNGSQQYYISMLAQDIDSSNPLVASFHSQIRLAGHTAGKGSLESEQLSAMSLKGKVSVQATIVAMKDLTGDTVLMIVATIGLVLTLPYHKKETT